MGERLRGKVNFFHRSRGFGFITTNDGGKLLVHESSIRGDGVRILGVGEDVEYQIGSRPDGGTMAVDVTGPFESIAGKRLSGVVRLDITPTNEGIPPGDNKPSGTVKWFNDERGIGFITPDEGGDDLFVHRSQIRDEGFWTLVVGEAVEYKILFERDGRHRACDITGPGVSNVQKGERRYYGGSGYRICESWF